MLDAIRIAFARYSRIPVQNSECSEQGLRYSPCFFLLVGAVIGAAEYMLLFLLLHFHAGVLLRGSLLALLPVVVTGGMHLLGFMSSWDAVLLGEDKEEKLAVMEEHRASGFSVICLVIYLLILVCAWSRIPLAAMPFVFLTFLSSRTLTALAGVSFPRIDKDGALVAEENPKNERPLGIIGAEAAALAVAIIVTGIVCSHLGLAVLMLVLLAAVYALYLFVMLHQFGGTTEALSDWFLQLAELACLLAIALVSLSW